MEHDLLIAMLPGSLFPFHILQARPPCQIVMIPITEATRPKTMLVITSGDNDVDEEEAATEAGLGDMDIM